MRNQKDRLRELRVGISAKAVNRHFAIAWDGPDLHQVDHKAQWPGASTIGERRLGVLGVLVGRVFDIRKKQKAKVENKDSVIPMASAAIVSPEVQPIQPHAPTPGNIENGGIPEETNPETIENGPLEGDLHAKETSVSSDITTSSPSVTFNIDSESPSNGSDNMASNNNPNVGSTGIESDQFYIDQPGTLNEVVPVNGQSHEIVQQEPSAEPTLRRSQSHSRRQSHFCSIQSQRDRLEGKLRLQTLELERISLSVAVLQKAFDWTVLTNITILDCSQHEKLWVMLRKHFQPTQLGSSNSSTKHGSGISLQYHLSLRKIHTDAASHALIRFLRRL